MTRTKRAKPARTSRERRPAVPNETAATSRRGTTYKSGRITREAIVRAAQSILIEHGHANFTVQRVAEKVGISPGNLNYHFPTRAALFETLIVYTLAQYRHRVRTAGDELNAGTNEALGDVLLWLMNDATSDHTNRLFRELWAVAMHDDKVAKAIDMFYTRSVHAHLRRATQRSRSSQEHLDLEAIVYLIHVISEGSTVLFGTRPGSRALFERVQQAAYRAVMHLVAAAPGGPIKRKAPG